jgi:hypothetical protein
LLANIAKESEGRQDLSTWDGVRARTRGQWKKH